MHSMRIPYPIEEKQMYYVDDFRVLHLAYLNEHRVASKRRFYQFVDWEMNKRPSVVLSRAYAQTKENEQVFPLPDSFLYCKNKFGFDLPQLVDTKISKCYMDEYIVERFSRHSMKELRKLDIWDDVFVRTYGLKDPRRMIDKLIQYYFNKTAKKENTLIISVVDGLLKRLY